MPFHTADYDTYILLGSPDAPPLWHWDTWQRLLPQLDPLIAAARGKPAVRSNQNGPDARTTLKFGRLGWNPRDHQKWTLDSPLNPSTGRRFLSTEVWAPSWNQCVKDDSAPDVFLCLANRFNFHAHLPDTPPFNPLVLFATVSTLANASPHLVAAALTCLREITAPKLIAFQRRPWGKPFGAIGFTDSLQDLAYTGLFKPGTPPDYPIDFSLFAEPWSLIP